MSSAKQNKNSPQNFSETLTEAISTAFATANKNVCYCVSARLCLFILSLWAIWAPSIADHWIFLAITLVITVALIVLSQRASQKKAKAQYAKRVHEFWEGLGTVPPSNFLADLKLSECGILPPSKVAELGKGLEFASKEEKGPRRLLENLEQSAWFSKRPCQTVGWFFVAITALLALVSLIILMGNQSWQPSTSDFMIKLAGALLLFALSSDLFENAINYLDFANSAAAAEKSATELLRQETITESEALQALTEYQVARASAPTIPTFVWKRGRDKMNAAWDLHKG